MITANWAEYWWSKVTGPNGVVLSTISALRARKSAVLFIPHDLPWRHELRKAVRNSLESIPGLEDLIVDVVDVEDENADGIKPENLLLDRYALREDRTRFREGGRESIQEYLLRKMVMKNKLVWIKGLSAGCSQQWVDFSEHWQPRDIADGVLVIETRDRPHISANRRVEFICYDEYVSEYDAQLFNSLMIGDDELNLLSAPWKKYAASITTHLCGTDAEVARSFIEQHSFITDDPIETIERIVDAGCFDRRGSGAHVLALCRAGKKAKLRERVWAGQIEVLFPLIERQRLEIVDEHRIQLDAEIKHGLMQFDNPVEKPEDIELGTMVYLMSARRLNIPSYEMRERIHLLRNCRNQLAHRDICNLDQVKALLDF